MNHYLLRSHSGFCPQIIGTNTRSICLCPTGNEKIKLLVQVFTVPSTSCLSESRRLNINCPGNRYCTSHKRLGVAEQFVTLFHHKVKMKKHKEENEKLRLSITKWTNETKPPLVYNPPTCCTESGHWTNLWPLHRKEWMSSQDLLYCFWDRGFDSSLQELELLIHRAARTWRAGSALPQRHSGIWGVF